jgi:hypothetical protein
MTTQAEISLNPLTAKGQILTSNGSSRIAVSPGTNGQFLVASSSSSSGLSWSTFGGVGGVDFFQIATASLTANAASLTFSNIPSTYSSLRLVFNYRGAATENLILSINSATTTVYASVYAYADGGVADAGSQANRADGIYTTGSSNVFSNEYGMAVFDFVDYASTSKNKIVLAECGATHPTSSNSFTGLMCGVYRSTSAISSITLKTNGGGNFYGTTDASSTTIAHLYGLKRYGL